MLTLSSPMFSSDHGWLFDESMSHQQQYFTNTDNIIPKDLLLSQPPQPQDDDQSLLHFYFSQPSGLRFDPVTPSPTPIRGDPTMVKKLNHNASERDRRKKINGLYHSLRSLLPASDQNKKLSVPTTVTRVLKYIPELQHQVRKLAKEKEELLPRIPSKTEPEEEISPSLVHRRDHLHNSSLESGFVFANRLNEREVAVQISTQKKGINPLSDIMLGLETDGFSLINASTFGDNTGMAFYTLHVQTEKADYASDSDKLREKVLSMCRKKSDRCVLQRRPGIH